MKQDIKKEIQFFQSREEPRYDNDVSETILKLSGLNGLLPNFLILDAGCGRGYWGRKIAIQNHRVVGIDINSSLAQNKRNANLVFVRGDLKHTPFRDRSFDVIFCGGILHHFPTREEVELVLKEMSRCLKRNGKIIIVEPNGSNPVVKLSRMFGKLAVNFFSADFSTINENAHSYKDYSTALNKADFSDVRVVSYQEKFVGNYQFGLFIFLLLEVRRFLADVTWLLLFRPIKGTNLVITALS